MGEPDSIHQSFTLCLFVCSTPYINHLLYAAMHAARQHCTVPMSSKPLGLSLHAPLYTRRSLSLRPKTNRSKPSHKPIPILAFSHSSWRPARTWLLTCHCIARGRHGAVMIMTTPTKGAGSEAQFDTHRPSSTPHSGPSTCPRGSHATGNLRAEQGTAAQQHRQLVLTSHARNRVGKERP